MTTVDFAFDGIDDMRQLLLFACRPQSKVRQVYEYHDECEYVCLHSTAQPLGDQRSQMTVSKSGDTLSL